MGTNAPAGRTDVGRRRDHNEDTFEIVAEHNLYMVADGLGGYAAGEVASRLCVDAVGRFFTALEGEAELTWGCTDAAVDTRPHSERVFDCAVQTANRRVWEVSRRYRAYHGMSTTFVGLRVDDGRWTVAWVGDSRCYRLRGGRIEALTTDHSAVAAHAARVARGEADPTSPPPAQNLILRAIGVEPEVLVDTRSGDVRPGDVFLLCSDGLCGELSDTEIEGLIAARSHDSEALCADLVAAANAAGGRDNVTAVAVTIPHGATSNRDAPIEAHAHALAG